MVTEILAAFTIIFIPSKGFIQYHTKSMHSFARSRSIVILDLKNSINNLSFQIGENLHRILAIIAEKNESSNNKKNYIPFRYFWK